MDQLRAACQDVATEIEGWDPTRHAVECVEVVEQFATERHAKAYAAWLMRDGAFEGVEHYHMGIDSALAA